MTRISGILLEIRLRKVVLTFSVFKKLKERLLICSSFEILPLKDLINSISAPLLGLLGVSSFVGPPITSRLVLLRNIPLQSNLIMLSTHSQISWNLVVVYGPCRQPARDQFVN
jgi:hypothetical protein